MYIFPSITINFNIYLFGKKINFNIYLPRTMFFLGSWYFSNFNKLLFWKGCFSFHDYVANEILLFMTISVVHGHAKNENDVCLVFFENISTIIKSQNSNSHKMNYSTGWTNCAGDLIMVGNIYQYDFASSTSCLPLVLTLLAHYRSLTPPNLFSWSKQDVYQHINQYLPHVIFHKMVNKVVH